MNWQNRRLLWGWCILLSWSLLLDSGLHSPSAYAGSKKKRSKTVLAEPSKGSGGTKGTFANEKMTVGSEEREYRLVVPETVELNDPLPLVFAFHGLGDSKDLMPVYSQLDKLAEKQKFVLVFPNARHRMWHLAAKGADEDLAFFDALYKHLTNRYNIDLNRVYLTGMSNGAYFTHVIASQRPEQIAAIAPHSGGLGVFSILPIQVKQKYAVLVIHGEKDRIVPVAEGQRTREAYKKWNHPVEYWEIPNHDHFWGTLEGSNTRIWEFFQKHPRSR